MVGEEKEKIHVLMNIDNYFGSHQGRLAPIILFLLASAMPFLLYAVLLMKFIPLKLVIIFELFWTFRMALLILGDEKTKKAQYLKEIGYTRYKVSEAEEDNSNYVTANDLMRIMHVKEDGLIEYVDGKVAYVVSGFCMTYLDDVQFAEDMKNFVSQLEDFNYDIYVHNVNDEFRLQDGLRKLRVYSDREMIQERAELYKEQDEYCRSNSELFRISFLVKASKYDWKRLKLVVDTACSSETMKVFRRINVCGEDAVNDILSRDTCLNVNMKAMLVKKYANEEYYGSEVLFYGDSIPEEYKPKRDEVNMQGRRVISE